MTRRHFKLHPDCPPALRRLYRECERSVPKVAAQLKVNPRYVWELLKFGKIPANPKIARRCFVEEKITLRRGLDRRRRHVRWFESKTAAQQDLMLEFLFHYKEGESMPKPEYEDDPDLCPCCACGTLDRSRRIRNIIMLHQKAPIPGTGWGCVVCGLPFDGAAAVICDVCLAAKAEIRFAMVGFPTEKRRIPVSELCGDHDHIISKHPELAVQ